MVIAETDRLRLRQLAPSDAAFLCRLLNEPSWLQNIGDRDVRTVEDAERYIHSKIMESYRTLGFGMNLVESKTGCEPMGVCGLVKRDALPVPDIGFAFLPEFWGQGYAFEAASALMRDAEVSLGLNRLLAIVSPGNDASCRLLEKLGFKSEGHFRLNPEDKELELYAVAI
ncbi:MAG: GNAT family N-acetyltransferase [Gammaproteobacteria bacterium]